jgi:hypothetical protein
MPVANRKPRTGRRAGRRALFSCSTTGRWPSLVHLTLNHGVYSTRTVVTADHAAAAIDEWQPHLVIFDADLGGQRIMQHVAPARLAAICQPFPSRDAAI